MISQQKYEFCFQFFTLKYIKKIIITKKKYKKYQKFTRKYREKNTKKKKKDVKK